MQPKQTSWRLLLCLLVSAWFVFLQGLPTHLSAAERSSAEEPTTILASDSAHVTAVLVKEAADSYGLSRRDLATELWLPLACLHAPLAAASFHAPQLGNANLPLCEFARREVSGALLS